MSANILAQLLTKYRSLIEMAPKVPAKDRESLSLVYTPGVADVCKVIQKNPEEIYNLTNKGNSILILTDGSACPSDKDPKNYSLLPYLETLAVFYKQVANIDAYPIIIDRSQLKSPEDFFEILDNLTPGFAGYELYCIDQAQCEKLEALCSKKLEDTLLLTPCLKEQVDHHLGPLVDHDEVKSYTLVAAFIRASLDCRAFKVVSKEVIIEFAEAMKKHKKLLEKQNYYKIAEEAVFEAAKVLVAKNLNGVKCLKPEDVRMKLARYFIEGPQSWLRHSSFDYLDERHGYKNNAVELHRVHIGVTQIKPKLSFRDISVFRHLFNQKNLQEVRDFILKDPLVKAYEITLKNNVCAIITNGTAILGLGDIGSVADMPVMEGKSVLFKQLAGVDVVPIGIKEKDADKVVNIITKFGHTFAAVNLEDIKAPQCFTIEKGLQDRLNIPVFHDDQHGTAIVAVAAFLNSIKLAKKKLEEVKIIINGAGAASTAICELLFEVGAKKIIICDTKGAIYEERPVNMNPKKNNLAKITNRDKEKGSLEDVIKGADLFLGVSVGGVLSKEMIKSMNKDPIIFAFANPDPEIMPSDAKEAGALVVATGRSDFPNQVNNSLVFPGIFRGAIDIRAPKISMKMKVAAAHAIANLVDDERLNPTYIIPEALDFAVPLAVATEVVKVGVSEGVALKGIKGIDLEQYREGFKYFVLHGEFNPDKDISMDGEEKIDVAEKRTIFQEQYPNR